MTPAQSESEPGHATGPRTHIRSWRRRGTTKSEGAPLSHLRRRCTGGAFTGGGAYLAVIVTTAFGMLAGLGAVAALCTLGAILAGSDVPHAKHSKAPPCDYAVDDIDWAIQFGAELAEAFPDRGAENAAPRGPIIR